ncbi:MAG TPA: heparinase II/III family protein [Gemmatimonadaceae bacterium]|nr:heparinase II/III family protein [Gemmatimonadaceae bacterium]
MSLLLTPEMLRDRMPVVRGPLAPLAQSLRDELEPLVESGPHIPTEKALLSRDGGRCASDGALLRFDPFMPHEHRCPDCSAVYSGQRHDRWWIMGYQLWLAERAVHAAALHALSGDPALAGLAAAILRGYAEQYLDYPNRDNVLGPTRPFFGTYLESIWLLQLCIALDLLEMAGEHLVDGAAVRDRLIEPSSALIASFDEGNSNRQVWNNAALIAAHVLLGEHDRAEQVVTGRSGLIAHLASALLPDGSWYEGENYHLFAHRGLWYGVTLAERAGLSLPPDLVRRFEEGFAVPLATMLPNWTLPARRDSHYAISVRQWRFADSFELGLARRDDARLAGALCELYSWQGPRRDTGRWRSTAEAERNEPASGLSRSDLGWRSLLLARAQLPVLEPAAPRSALLEAQGIAVLRRNAGRTYVALDYGHSGGGHGHPDRLNLLLATGSDVWLDDVGTGSYVDPSLHWYRSTLAHNAPLFGGRSQFPVHGVLRAFEERGGAGWVDAEVPRGGLAPGGYAARSVVAMPGYAVDRVMWESSTETRFELPLHVNADVEGVGAWCAKHMDGGAGPEDGFAFVRDAAMATVPSDATVHLELRNVAGGEAYVLASGEAAWWRATAPGAPGQGDREFLMLRMHGRGGSVTTVWSWNGTVAGVRERDGVLVVELADGTRHEHARCDDSWHIDLFAGAAHSSIDLAGVRPRSTPIGAGASVRSVVPTVLPPGGAFAFHLAREAYRMSEVRWEDAGRPEADVTLRADQDLLHVDVQVRKQPVYFRPADAPDPALDNEHPDIHSDGVQLHLHAPWWREAAAWLAVPIEGSTDVRIRTTAGAYEGVPLDVSWTRTEAGYTVHFALPLAAMRVEPDRPAAAGTPFAVDVLVNDMVPGRERRRGQLVLSGGAGDYIYLRGDRQPLAFLLPFIIPPT